MRSTLLCAVSVLALASVAFAAAPCRFAPSFDAEAIFSDPATQSEFIETVMMRENHFLQPTPCPLPPVSGQDLTNIGYHAATGMTLDGHRWTVEEGLPLGEPHLFTAASKESLHLAMIALALQSNLPAQLFFSPADPANASAVVLDVLTTKVNTFDSFFETYPGFGGFLPWVFVSDAGLTPTLDFNSSVPSLDNGQMFWGAYAVAKILSRDYPDVLHRPLKRASTSNDELYLSPTTTLAQRWTNIYTRMIANALIVFYDSRTNSTLGQFRTVSQIVDRTLPIDPTMSPYEASANYQSAPSQSYLNDPYEGELFTNMAFLFSDWSWTGASSDAVWVYKRAMLQAVPFQVADPSDPAAPPTTITVERGFWYSGHEKWKYFLCPYLSSEWSSKVFAAGEKARTWNSVQQSLAGGFASCAGMAETDAQDTGYKSDCGIQDLAFESVGNTDILTPYAFSALMLASPSHGLAWYHNMLLAPRAQTCFGSLEALNRTGANIAPLSTWDTKVTTLLTMAGGLQSTLADLLSKEPVNAHSYNSGVGGSGVPIPSNVTSALDLFVFAVDREWFAVFAGLALGEELDYARPQVQIDTQLPQWTSCRDDTDVCQCSAESLKHQKAMAEAARGVDRNFEEQKAAAESRRPAVDPMHELQQQQQAAEQ